MDRKVCERNGEAVNPLYGCRRWKAMLIATFGIAMPLVGCSSSRVAGSVSTDTQAVKLQRDTVREVNTPVFDDDELAWRTTGVRLVESKAARVLRACQSVNRSVSRRETKSLTVSAPVSRLGTATLTPPPEAPPQRARVQPLPRLHRFARGKSLR